VQYALINDRATLLYLVNQGALTFHVWFSRVQDLDRPDFVLFDLDSGQASFAEVIVVAKQLHVILEAQNVAAFVKTSGKSGLHVLTPWERAGDCLDSLGVAGTHAPIAPATIYLADDFPAAR
jgi:bifunctional non-homologous end joining protein LigD